MISEKNKLSSFWDVSFASSIGLGLILGGFIIFDWGYAKGKITMYEERAITEKQSPKEEKKEEKKEIKGQRW